MGLRSQSMTMILVMLLVSALMDAASAQESGWANYRRTLPQQPCPRTLPLSKLMFNQSDYIQYVHYVTAIPDIRSFTIQYWFNLISTNRTSTMFDYTKKGPLINNTLLIQLDSASYPQQWILRIDGELVSSVDSPVIRAGEWHHMVHSWDSNTGIWSVFMDGALLAANVSPVGRRAVIPGGGEAVSGQRQNTLGNGMDQGEGLEGWFTLLQMSHRPLLYPHSQGASAMASKLTSQCDGVSHGEIISWTRTPRKGYGGIMEAPSRQVCRQF